MLNQIAFKPGGAPTYRQYIEATAPLMTKVGGKTFYVGAATEELIGNEPWDLLWLVQYPNRKALLQMLASDEYRAVARLREESVARSALHATDPAGPLPD